MDDPPLLLGHRGARASASVRENTPASFDLALQHGCDGFEFDVRLTRDGAAVICHDDRFKGTSVGKASAIQLRGLPVFEDVLAGYAKRAFLDIELKVPGLAPRVLAALGKHPPARGCVISSFLPDVLIEIETGSGSTPLGIICDRKKQLQPWRQLPVEYVIPHYSLITPDLAHQVRDAGKMLFAWTVNDKAAMLRLAGWGVHGIISDKTELLVKTLRTGGLREGFASDCADE